MQNKLITMEQAVARYTWDGMVYSHGGPIAVGSDSIAFGREMLRQGRRDLNCFSLSNTQQTNLLAAAGAIRRIEVGFAGLEVYGFANGLRRMVEAGKVVLEDYSNGGIILRALGGALNWPFVPAVVSAGSDQEWCCADDPDAYPNTRKIPAVTDPFTGRTVHVMSCVKPDVAAIHVTMADMFGNAIMLGTEWARYELSRAAKKVVLQADFIVDTDCMRQYPNLVRIPGELVDAVVYWPMGVWPACSNGVYDSDEEHMKYMNAALKTEEGTAEYIEKYVMSYKSREEYLAMIGPEKIRTLCDNPTTFLMDPYRKWIRSDGEILALERENA